MAPHLCQILGVGARGPLGLNALQVAMGARAGKIEPRRTRFADKHGNSMGAVRARFLPDDLHGYDRLVALAVPALVEAARGLAHASIAPPYPLFLALPEPGRPDDDPRFGPEMLAELARRSGLPIDLERSLVIRSGHAGGGMALSLAALRLAEGGRPTAYLVGGVDSYYHQGVLKWLDVECRLHSGTAGNGIIPSEGAAFAALAASTADGSNSSSVGRALARISSAVAAREDTVGTTSPNLAAAMTRAVRDAATLAGGRPISWVLTDVNGERHRISEFAKVQIRSKDLFTETFHHEALAEELGDVGAASGALLLAAACVHFRAGSAPAERVLVALHAEGQERAAFVLDSIPRAEAPPTRASSAFLSPPAAPPEAPAQTEAPTQQEAIDRVVASLGRLPATTDRGLLRTALDETSAALSRWAASDLHDDDHLARLDAAATRLAFARARFEDAGDSAAATQSVKTLQHAERALRKSREVTIDHLVAAQDRRLHGEVRTSSPEAAPFRASVDLPVVHASSRDPLLPLSPLSPASPSDSVSAFHASPPALSPSPDALALRDLARACMEDIAILGGLRRPNDDESWSAPSRFERRLLANIDALSTLDSAEVGPAEGLDVPAAVLAYSAESSFADTGRAFARAFSLGCFGGENPVRAAVLGLRTSHPLTRAAQLDALCLTPSPRVVPAMERLLWDEDPALVRLALDVLRFRRAARLASLLPLLSHPDLGVIEAAARCLAVTLPRASAIASLEGLLRDGLEDRSALVVLESLIALGAPSGVALTTQRLLEAEARPLALSSDTRTGLVRLLALAGGPEHTALLFNAVLSSDARAPTPAGVTALGWFGHAAFLEPLLEQLESANAAPRTAGMRPTDLEIAIARALLRITGVYLEEETNAYGIGLSVDASAWRAHWDDTPSDLAPDVRYRFGVRYHPRESLTELADDGTPAHARRNAALELAALTASAFPFEPTDWVARQRTQLAVLGDAIESSAAAYEPGEWLSTHLLRRPA